ncbi:MAG: family 43 glycosylhydrolase [Dysgonomonas sp.]|nr:family 43 glycosylhydrolase [Dysgonomonas sp.]
MSKVHFLLILSLLFLSNLQSQNKTFSNPVIHGDVADPSIIRIADTYYATGTSSEWAPFYPMFMSKDLVNWTQTGHVFNKQPEWTSSSFWAPELYVHNNKVYCYYTARRKSDNISYIGVAVADSPTDEFTDHGLLIEFGTEAIDAFVYNDNGQLYISWKAYGLDKRPIELIGSKLSDDGLKLVGEPFSMLKDDDNIGMEGQYHFKKGDYYYIVYAAHGCCGPGSDYDVYVARSKNFVGPYEKYEGNPILYGGNNDFQSCGHGTAVETLDGRMFYMCHAYMKGDGFYMGRQPILQEMYVGDDNWVRFRSGKIAKIEQPMPFKGIKQKGISNFEDKFDSKTLKVDWTWNYIFTDIQTRIEKGNLYLSGTPKQGNSFGTVLCLRTQTPNYSFETQVINNNSSMKGLTIYGDNNNLVAWGIADNKLTLKFIKDGKENILYQSEENIPSVYLKVEITKATDRSFYWSKNGKQWTKVDDSLLDMSGLVRWDRVARPGMIHIGDENNPAGFSYFKLINK